MAGVIFTKSAGLNDDVFGKSLFPIKALIENKAEAYEKASIINKIYNVSSSNNFGEKVGTMTSMNGFKPVNEGGASPSDEFQEGYSQTLEHVQWMDSFSITKAAMDDNKILDLRTRPTAFINGFYRTREDFGTKLLAGAVNVSGATGAAATLAYNGMSFSCNSADGVSLFSKYHPSATSNSKGANQTNVFAAPSSGDAFTSTVLAKAETAMQNFKDDNGNPLAIIPDTIIIPNNATLKQQVFSVIGADKDPGTANNGFNYTFGRWNVIVTPYWVLSGSDLPWILMSSQYNTDNLGALWYDRTPLTIRTDIDENTWNSKFSGYSRWSAGFNDWRFALMGGVTSGTAL